jgi:hypothetical protein
VLLAMNFSYLGPIYVLNVSVVAPLISPNNVTLILMFMSHLNNSRRPLTAETGFDLISVHVMWFEWRWDTF